MEQSILQRIKELGIDTYAVDVRSYLHQHPDLSDHEGPTRDYIAGKLEELNIEYTSGIADTGLVAVIPGDPYGPVIGLRADMDALPIQEENPDLDCRSTVDGVMHACGHDIHSAILLGVGKYFAENRSSLPGTVKLFFQPAEEGNGGAQRMIDEGCLEHPSVDAILGLHVEPSLQTGTVGIRYGKMYAASDVITLKVHGVSCHGATPELGVDAIAIAASIIEKIQSIPIDKVGETRSAVCSFGTIHGGNVENQIADYVELHGIIRSLDQKTRSAFKEQIRSICEDTAHGMGGTAELIIQPSYAPLINDNTIVDSVRATVEQMLGTDAVILEESPILKVEDFAYFALVRPACYYHLGCRTPGDTSLQVLHNSSFNPDPGCIAYGIALQVQSALNLMKQL